MRDVTKTAAITATTVLMGELRSLAGTREVEVTLPPGSTVRDLLHRLAEASGRAFADRVLTEDGSLQAHIAVFVNERDIRDLQGIDTPLADDRVELVMLPAFEGGA